MSASASPGCASNDQCHDLLLKHKTALFDHLTDRWLTPFDAKFEVVPTFLPKQ